MVSDEIAVFCPMNEMFCPMLFEVGTIYFLRPVQLSEYINAKPPNNFAPNYRKIIRQITEH